MIRLGSSPVGASEKILTTINVACASMAIFQALNSHEVQIPMQVKGEPYMSPSACISLSSRHHATDGEHEKCGQRGQGSWGPAFPRIIYGVERLDEADMAG